MIKKRREILNALMSEIELDVKRGFSKAEAVERMKNYFGKNDDYKNECLYEEHGDLYVQIVEEFLAVAEFFTKK